MRYRGEKAVEHVRRRAEAQNIAVVKSLDGYVLAPMHEGRVVRSDVFRALPEALKRNVEAKITALEEELQSIVATLPDVEFEASEKYGALIRQTATSRRSAEPHAVEEIMRGDGIGRSRCPRCHRGCVPGGGRGERGGARAFAPITVRGLRSRHESSRLRRAAPTS